MMVPFAEIGDIIKEKKFEDNDDVSFWDLLGHPSEED